MEWGSNLPPCPTTFAALFDDSFNLIFRGRFQSPPNSWVGANLVPNNRDLAIPGRPITRPNSCRMAKIHRDRSRRSGRDRIRNQQVVGSIPTAG